MEKLLHQRLITNIYDSASTLQPNPTINDPGSLLKDLEFFKMETIDEKVRLVERLRIVEEQNS